MQCVKSVLREKLLRQPRSDQENMPRGALKNFLKFTGNTYIHESKHVMELQ